MSESTLPGKTALVTGATNGIGFITARELAKAGMKVLLHGRDAARGLDAVARIWSAVPGADVTYVEADFADLASVRKLAASLTETVPRLDVLVNNAGAIFARREVSAQGYELTFAVNHLAPFLLTNLLLGSLKAAAPARIVNVASRAHRGPQIDFSDINLVTGYWPGRAYQTSKLANILFTRALARRLEGTGVTANCLHPGVVRTHFAQDKGGIIGIGFRLLSPLFIPAEDGAKTSLYLSLSPDVASVSSTYFDKCAPLEPSRMARDDSAAEALWTLSAEMVGLTF